MVTTIYGLERADSNAVVHDDGDSSKKMRFELSAIATGTTRIVNVGDADSDVALLLSETASGTNPTIIPVAADPNTGVGRQAADNLSLVAGGLEAIRAEDPADLGAAETSLWIFDDDNNTIEQVTVGSADSGGSNFKLLRIAN